MAPFRCTHRVGAFAAEFSTNHPIMATDQHTFKGGKFRIARFNYISGIALAVDPEVNIET